MTHLVDELKATADDAMALMRAAAVRARDAHARAELMRHMLMTAGRVKAQPTQQAVRFIVDHWLEAWGLTRAAWPHVAPMEAFAAAFHAYANGPTDANDRAVRETCARLEQAFTGAGMPIADQMAWRSMCAHGWWGEVKPAPRGRGRADREWPERPFWDNGCLPECEEN
jgi:hypothetical protein